MGNGTILQVGMGDLDSNIKSKVSDHIFFTVNSMNMGSNISDTELDSIFKSGLRKDVISLIKEYYEFLGEININLSDVELRDIYKTYV